MTGDRPRPKSKHNSERNSEHNSDQPPSIWLGLHQPEPPPTASFVEYLRWMRSPNVQQKDATKVRLLQDAQETANYFVHLNRLIKRTKLLAGEGNWFEVRCPWRIRVGGRKGPEDMLLPAFDAIGMPYIPSSTLRGIARAQAVLELTATKTKQKLESGVLSEDARKQARQEAERLVHSYFGALDAKPQDRCGKVIFLDAYPTATKENPAGGLRVDMVNPVWEWANDQQPTYKPKPNPFFSLQEPTFVIGLRHMPQCTDTEFATVKRWLQKGLLQGIGSRTNSGYGELCVRQPRTANAQLTEALKKEGRILSVSFTLKGQLIHGRQRLKAWNRDKEQWNSEAVPEVRPVAFRSMLRYWFRAFAMGVLPQRTARALEVEVFGGIEGGLENKPYTSWFRLEINKSVHDEEGQQIGTLILRHSPTTQGETEKRQVLSQLLKSLTWLMFHLGGVGQGARRPLYDRGSNNLPRWRGSELIPTLKAVTPEIEQQVWALPEQPRDFQERFRSQLQRFYSVLEIIANDQLNYQRPIAAMSPSADRWIEAIDKHCAIVAVRKANPGNSSKPFALEVLNRMFHAEYDQYRDAKERIKQAKRNCQQSGSPSAPRSPERFSREDCQHYTNAKNLCGGVENEKRENGFSINRETTPSPIWIVDLDEYQIITVFGVTKDSNNPRWNYLLQLQSELNAAGDEYIQLWGSLQSGS